MTIKITNKERNFGNKFTCPSCGYKTLEEGDFGTHEICGMCGWQDDFVQYKNPDYRGVANGGSLIQHQYDFLKEQLKDNDDYGFVKDTEWNIYYSPLNYYRNKNSKPDFVVNRKGIAKEL
jgi:hypothetical protein